MRRSSSPSAISGFSQVRGVFRDFEATIDFDPGNVEATQVDIQIDAGIDRDLLESA